MVGSFFSKRIVLIKSEVGMYSRKIGGYER
jgi:hypothetical protein